MHQTNNRAPIDLDFDGHNTLYATHGLHSFAAKCPPQLARYAIERFSEPGEVVLDPMAGSGTTLVEARLLGRNAVGFDLDPLSCLIMKVKSSELEDASIEDAYNSVIRKLKTKFLGLYLEIPLPESIECDIPLEFPNREYWFSPPVRDALAQLSYTIACTQMREDVRSFLWVAFSSIILTKVSVANARDITHSRHHHFEHRKVPDVLDKFDRRVRRMRNQIAEFRDLCKEARPSKVEICEGDARQLSLANESVDLIFTSPPYATALDYTRAHFLAVGWMRESLGVSLNEYKNRGATYIGSERGTLSTDLELNSDLERFDRTKSIITELHEKDARRGKLIHRYFKDMQRSLKEMSRVLKDGRKLVMVICPSHIRKVEVPTHKVFSEMGNSVGLNLIHEYTRSINANRRVMPYIRESFGNRMSTEYVQVYEKGG